MRTLWLAALLVALGIVISIDVIPGVFTVDDNNYLVNVVALRHGRVTLANTEGLTPSRELLFFDPTARSRAVTSTPVGSTAPPLYALVALPFSWFGWRGLVALNTLSYLATILLVFRYADRHSTNPSTAWLAAGAFALGGYMIEYTLGLWPHALSVFLCTAGIIAAGRVVDGGDFRFAAAAGFLLALATGVRYQNAIVLGSVGAGVFLWASARWRGAVAFGAGAAVPLSASALINHARFGLWNPISKGPGYLDFSSAAGTGSAVRDAVVMFWARLVDFSVRPPLVGPDFNDWYHYDPATGAHMILGVVLKKALLQSAPWTVLAVLLFIVVWLPNFRVPAPQRRQLRLFSLVTFAVLITFALAGTSRHDGLSFNERYLLEIVPLAALAFAWALDDMALPPLALGIGAALGGILAVVIVLRTPIAGGPEIPLWVFSQLALLRIPLALAAMLAVVWLLDRAGYRRRALLSGIVGVCLAWGLTVHVTTDVVASQLLRGRQIGRTRALASVLTDGTALVAYWGSKDAAGPLLLDRDVVILEAQADEGQDAPVLIRELLAKNRRVFVLEDGFSAEALSRVLSGVQVTPVEHQTLPMVEVRSLK